MAEGTPLTVAQVVEALELSVLAGAGALDKTVTGAQVGDLLSYIMAQGKPGHLWITIQTHANIVAVAALKDFSGIVLAGDFAPGEETVERADEEEIPLLRSKKNSFVLAGRLYALGVR